MVYFLRFNQIRPAKGGDQGNFNIDSIHFKFQIHTPRPHTQRSDVFLQILFIIIVKVVQT
jgi:hypothetical protein